MSQDLGGLGRHFLQGDAYGAAAFCFYRAMLENTNDAGAWNGMALALSLMRKEHDTQTLLARYAMQKQLPYDKELATIAFMMFQNNPLALSAWVRSMSARFGASSSERQTYTEMADEVENGYRKLVLEYGEEALRAQDMLPLEEIAERKLELDLLLSEPMDAVFANIQAMLGRPDTELAGVRLLAMLPDPRTEKLLRRVCRNEEADPKVRTHALLAMKWVGIGGNVRLNKMDESFIIDLDNPQPELTLSVPTAYQPALERMKLWMAKEQGFVTAEEYERFASSEEVTMPEELSAKVAAADIPGRLQEVVHAVIRSAYDHYYPLVPTIRGYRNWSNAFLIVMKEYCEGIGEGWKYGPLEQDATAVLHRNWMLSAYPGFHQELEEARLQRVTK